MQEDNSLLDCVNKIKELTLQLAYLGISVREENIVMTLLENFPTSYKYLITTLEMMLMKEMTMGYVMAHLMHEMLKRKEKEPRKRRRGNGVMSKQSKQSTFTACPKNMHLLDTNRTTLYNFATMQRTRRERERKCQKYKRLGRIRICNAIQSTFKERLQIYYGFGSHKAHDFT